MVSKKRRRIVPWILALISIAGVVCSLHYGRHLRQLRLEHDALAKQVGLLEVTDPKRVHMSWVPTSDEDIPPGIEAAHVWRFRLYLPANYGPCYYTRSRAIAADSPRSRGGSSSSWGGKKQDPVETVATLALIKADGRWMVSRINGGSSSTASMPNDFELESLEDLVVEPVVNEQTPRKSFSVDDAICLLRIRKKEPIDQNGKGPNFYPGFVSYLVESDRKNDFEQWMNGKVDQMPEVQP